MLLSTTQISKHLYIGLFHFKYRPVSTPSIFEIMFAILSNMPRIQCCLDDAIFENTLEVHEKILSILPYQHSRAEIELGQMSLEIISSSVSSFSNKSMI